MTQHNQPTVQTPGETDLTTLTTDPGDHHICALAVAGHAELLLTFDHGYISESLAEHGIRVLTPDAFLDTTLQENPARSWARFNPRPKYGAGSAH